MESSSKMSILEGEKVHLRFPSVEESKLVLDYFQKNQKHLASFSPPAPEGFYTEEYWVGRLKQNQDEFKLEKSVRLFISKKGGSAVIGSVSLTEICRGPFQAAYLGYAMDQDEQGKGLMTEALQLMIQFAFEKMNLHRLMANHLPSNKRSAAVLKRLGFVVEGTAKNYLRIEGKWQDHVLTSLTNGDWKGE
jgi:[ribosomal protein S5]-alanine N-acetyltransferase